MLGRPGAGIDVGRVAVAAAGDATNARAIVAVVKAQVWRRTGLPRWFVVDAHGSGELRRNAGVRLRRLDDRTIIWTHVQFAVAVFAGPLTAMVFAPFRGGSLAAKGRVCE
jgi:hypothetical protein